MPRPSHSSERIVIVGGGFAGLSAAARLAQAGLPVTVIESSKLGYAASTQNQGWLYSGAWFAKTDPTLAELCYNSLLQTLSFCPDCVEPGVGSMIYCSLENSTSEEDWVRAWEKAGIPSQPLLVGELNWDLPQMSRDRMTWAMRLPDRSFRPDVLLSQIAATARNAGAEIRANTVVTGLMMEDRSVSGVAVGAYEELPARLVILATGAFSVSRFPQMYQSMTTHQSNFELVCLKTHLRAITPGLSVDPFCLVDGVGLNHLPHHGTSVFGTSRWEVVNDADANTVDDAEVTILERQLGLLFPHGIGNDVQIKDWAGTTVQAMHANQIQPGEAPLPTVIDHAKEPFGVENVLSIFPGRATLWAELAEQVRTIVLEKFSSRVSETSQPPWAVSTPSPLPTHKESSTSI